MVKEERLQVRCSAETKVAFEEFVAGYTDQEQAIKDFLRVFRDYPGLFARRRGDPSLTE